MKRLHLSDSDWTIVIALIEVLAPYNHATKVFSGKTYQTLSISFIFTTSPRNILEQRYSINEEADDEDIHKHLKSSSYYALINSFKSLLLKATDIYHKRHVTGDQLDASLVSQRKVNAITTVHSNTVKFRIHKYFSIHLPV